VEKVAKKCGLLLQFFYYKTAQNKKASVGRKLAQSGHPAAALSLIVASKRNREGAYFLIYLRTSLSPLITEAKTMMKK
jgi:hypothetical protein